MLIHYVRLSDFFEVFTLFSNTVHSENDCNFDANIWVHLVILIERQGKFHVHQLLFFHI
jgi:hypothetical protein